MVGWGVGAALVLARVGCGRAPKAQTLSGDFHALQVLGSGTVLYGEHAGVRRSVDGGGRGPRRTGQATPWRSPGPGTARSWQGKRS